MRHTSGRKKAGTSAPTMAYRKCPTTAKRKERTRGETGRLLGRVSKGQSIVTRNLSQHRARRLVSAWRAKTTIAGKRALARLTGARENGAMLWLTSIGLGRMERMSPPE